MTTIGFLHPGQMGVSLAASVDPDRRLGITAAWAGDGRSPETTVRAEQAGLTDLGTIEGLAAASDIVVSICPPAAAVDVARTVAETGFDGIYVDANAISPDTVGRIEPLFDRYVDGGVIGPPATRPGITRLYLSGADGDEVAGAWTGSMLDVRVLPTRATGAASALKMAYAGYTKGHAALLLTVNALARSADVTDALREEWGLSQPHLIEASRQAAAGTGPKAWRFAGEMDEIAATMAGAALPTGFHEGASDAYRRLAQFKGSDGPDLDDVTAALLDQSPPQP